MVQRIVPDILVYDLPEAVKEYSVIHNLDVVMDLGSVVTLSDDAGHQITLVAATPGEVTPEVSVFVDDVRASYDAAITAGREIVKPITTESWGVTHFFYRDGAGHVVNVGAHTAAQE